MKGRTKFNHVALFLLTNASLLFVSAANGSDGLWDTMEALEKVKKQASFWEARQKSISINRQNDCFLAIGDKSFCDCLDQNLHWVMDFKSYIRIAISPDNPLPSNSTKEELKMVESVYLTRQECSNTP